MTSESHPHVRVLAWSLILFGSFVAHKVSDWYLLRISLLSGPSDFSDLRNILESVTCATASSGDFNSAELVSECGYIYGSSLLRAVAFLGLSESMAVTLGWILVACFSIALGSVISLTSSSYRGANVLALLSVNSPPMILLVERANFDIVIFILLVLSCWAISKQRPLVSLATLCLATITKFYTAPLLFWSAWKQRSIETKAVGFAAAIGASIWILPELTGASARIPRPTFVAFGLPTFGLYLSHYGISLHPRLQDALGIMLLGLMCLLIAMIRRSSGFNFPYLRLLSPETNFASVISSVFSLLFLVCYLSTSNFDYRLFLLLVSVLSYLKLAKVKAVMSATLSGLLVVALWTSITSSLQPLGDLAILFWAGLLTLSLLSEIQLCRRTKAN